MSNQNNSSSWNAKDRQILINSCQKSSVNINWDKIAKKLNHTVQSCQLEWNRLQNNNRLLSKLKN